MNRRGFFVSVGSIVALAGCIGDQEDSTSQETSTPISTSEPTPEPTPESTPESTVESTPEQTPESTSGPGSEPHLTIQDQSLSAADTPFHDMYVEATIKNDGSARCGSVELTARWLDDSGSFIGTDTAYLPTLGAGETWLARVGTSGEVEGVELSGEYDVSPGSSATGLSVVDHSLNIEDEYSGTITAEVENTREKSLFMTSFHGVLYDSEGRVIGGQETRESDISPGEDLFFEISLSTTRTVHRISKATDHMVLVTESETTDTRQF